MTFALIAVGCAGQTATPPPSTATIPHQVDRSAPQSEPPGQPTTAQPQDTTTPGTAAPDTSDADTTGASSTLATPPVQDLQGEPEPAANGEAADSNTPSPVHAISERGLALGCIDATELRRWLATTNAVVAEAAYAMPDLVWLCPQSAEVNAQLDCFPAETAAVLVELSAQLGPDVDAIVNEIQDSNTTFCGSGDHIRLGLDAILDSGGDP